MTTVKHQLTVRLTMILMAVCAVFLLIGGAADAEAPDSGGVEYVVRAGDTLWGIAAGHTDPGDDIRELITNIRASNGLDSATIHPGQILHIPQG